MKRARERVPVRDRIAGEHAAIDRLVLEILTELDRIEARLARVGGPWRLPLMVASLRDRLERHFALEERAGPLDQALRASPEVHTDVEELLVEHRAFTARLERLLAEMDCGFRPPQSVQSCFALELRKVIAGLRQHHAAELLLFERVFRTPWAAWVAAGPGGARRPTAARSRPPPAVGQNCALERMALGQRRRGMESSGTGDGPCARAR